MAHPAALLKIDALGAAALLAITAIAGAVALGPTLVAQRSTHMQQAEDLARLKRECAAAESANDKAHRSIDSLSVQAETAVHLLRADRVNDRLSELNALADENHVALAQMTPAAPSAESKNAVMVPIRLSGSATYASVSRFISAMHSRFRDTAVSAFRIAGPPSDNAPNADFSLDLAWYAAPADSATASVAPPK